MNIANQLPEPELGYIKTDKSNQPTFSARQMREMKDTNQLPPLPTPKFTEMIRGVPCITVTEHEHLMRAYALQILALRPERVPMTDEVEKCAVVAWAHFMDTCRKKRVSPADWGDWCSANAIRKSNHGITTKAKGEQ